MTYAATTIHLSTTSISMLTGWLIPVVVAFITKQATPGWIKGLAALFLSAVSGCLTALTTQGGSLDLAVFVVAVMHAFGAAVVAHLGIWKPAGITGSTGVIARRTRALGIGGQQHAQARAQEQAYSGA